MRLTLLAVAISLALAPAAQAACPKGRTVSHIGATRIVRGKDAQRVCDLTGAFKLSLRTDAGLLAAGNGWVVYWTQAPRIHSQGFEWEADVVVWLAKISRAHPRHFDDYGDGIDGGSPSSPPAAAYALDNGQLTFVRSDDELVRITRAGTTKVLATADSGTTDPAQEDDIGKAQVSVSGATISWRSIEGKAQPAVTA